MQRPVAWDVWFQRGSAAEGNGERTVRIRRCPAAVKRRLSTDVNQNARQDSKRRGSYERFDQSQPDAEGWCDLHCGIAHPFPVEPCSSCHPSAWETAQIFRPCEDCLVALVTPCAGPDHLLFLLAIAFIGLQRPQAWAIPLLAAGLGGSVVSQFIPLPDAVASWAEALVSHPGAAEGLMALSPSSLLLAAAASSPAVFC